MEVLVGGGQDFGLVDKVDAQRLQNLRLDKVTDANLCHDRNRDLGDNLLDHAGVTHAGNAALGAYVGGYALEGHHGGRARVLGDTRLFSVDNVHDNAALKHLRETGFDPQRSDLCHVSSVNISVNTCG